MPNRLQHLWALFKQTPGSLPDWARHIAAALGIATLTCVLVIYVRHAWEIDQATDAFVYWTGIITALGVFALRASRKEEENNDPNRRDPGADCDPRQ